MQQEHKRAIQVNFSSLVDRTDLKMMVSALYEKGVFSEAMLEHYANENISQLDRKRHLFNAITRRGPEAFAKLTEALMEMGHWDLVRDLDPNSPLHVRPSRPELRLNMPRPQEETDENNFVSLKNKKQEAKNMRQPGDSPSLPSPHSWPAAVETVVSVAPPLASNDATDLSLDIPDFHIKKSTSFFQEDESKGIRLYRTRGKYRGKLLLLSYVDFAYGTDEFRHGVEVDTKNLKYLFDEMGFQVLTYTNLTLDETKHMLQSLESVLVGAEMVFTVVSSHGYAQRHKADTSIRCSDGRLTTDGEIIEFFNHRNMPKLLGVPKVFIFQVCRGDVDDFVNMNANANPHLNVRALSAPRPQRVAVDAGAAPPSPAPPSPPSPSTPPADLRPLYSDTLVVHSTVPGFVSHRDKFDGSWYIQVLCEVFAESAHDCHVEKLFKLVDERMQQKYGIQTSSVDSRGFNKKLYLHPGLYE